MHLNKNVTALADRRATLPELRGHAAAIKS
jgi:hypothetical protein